MNSSNLGGGESDRIENLVRQIRFYKRKQQEHEIQRGQTSKVPQEDSTKTKRAAVLVCLFEENNGDLRVILTKRSSNLSSHSGEVALPGGKRDKSDADDAETALREAKEEVGLDPSLVNVVTTAEPFASKYETIVVPVIGILLDRKSFTPLLNASEVEAIFDAPLEMFLKDENRRASELEWMGKKYLIQFFDHEADGRAYEIWALTAEILINVASIIYQRPPAFPERSSQFWTFWTNDGHSKL